jgi:hypothetical protein
MTLRDLIAGKRSAVSATPATAATVRDLRTQNVARVATVADAETNIAEIEGMTLAAFGRSGLVLHVDSSVLGEQLLFVSDGYRPEPGDPVAYRAGELEALLGAPPELIRLVHNIKKTFLGARVAGPSQRNSKHGRYR